MQKIIITGVNGFVGHHLTQTAKDSGFEVIGVGHDPSCSPKLESVLDEYINCDLTDKNEVDSRLSLDSVDSVINLAGLASLGNSFGKEELYQNVNVGILENLCSAIGERAIRLIAISTGAVYSPNQSMPISESGQTIKDGPPYTLSKLAMEQKANEYRKKGMDVVIARPFNHIGPGQLPGFLVPDLANQVLVNDEVVVGNLKTSRDYTDVRDVVKAYIGLVSKPSLEHDVYNICSGISVPGEKILGFIMHYLDKHPEITVDESRFRPNDPEIIIGDNTRISKEIDWQPIISTEQTIEDYSSWLKANQ